MPIYEYRCEDCGRLTSQLVFKPTPGTLPLCRVCGSTRTQRVLSGFAYHRSEASRLAAFDASASNHPDFSRIPVTSVSGPKNGRRTWGWI